jgi:hypothetical protein
MFDFFFSFKKKRGTGGEKGEGGGVGLDEMVDEYLGTKMMNRVTNYMYGRMENKLMYLFLWDFFGG